MIWCGIRFITFFKQLVLLRLLCIYTYTQFIDKHVVRDKLCFSSRVFCRKTTFIGNKQCFTSYCTSGMPDIFIPSIFQESTNTILTNLMIYGLKYYRLVNKDRLISNSAILITSPLLVHEKTFQYWPILIHKNCHYLPILVHRNVTVSTVTGTYLLR